MVALCVASTHVEISQTKVAEKASSGTLKGVHRAGHSIHEGCDAEVYGSST